MTMLFSLWRAAGVISPYSTSSVTRRDGSCHLLLKEKALVAYTSELSLEGKLREPVMRFFPLEKRLLYRNGYGIF